MGNVQVMADLSYSSDLGSIGESKVCAPFTVWGESYGIQDIQ
jgi:hypothetical protein